MSRELPILFTGDMVRLLLSGAKTQTRRPVKINPYDGAFYLLDGWPHRSLDGEGNRVPGMEEPYRAPWSPGDVLYVREAWAERQAGHGGGIIYAADYQPPSAGDYLWRHRTRPQTRFAGAWRPSIHMPKRAARIHLRVLSVGVERVNAISEEDAMAEGCEGCAPRLGGVEALEEAVSPREEFAALWDSLYGAGSFAAGTWCWVTRFEVIR